MRGLGISKGFDKSRTNGWFLSVKQPDGSRPKQYFPSQKERDKTFNAKVLEVRGGGVEAASMSLADRQAMAEMKRLAAPTGMSVADIFQRGLVGLNGAISLTTLTAAQAAVQFFAEQEQRRIQGKISDVRMKEIRNTLTRFLKQHGQRRIALCNRSVIKTYLLSLKVGPQTQVNNARVLSFFFGWCVDEGIVLRNPVPEQEGVDRIPTVFTNQQVTELFYCAREHFPTLLPMLACQWYAGLRPGATHQLDWEHVDFRNGRFLIQPESNKLRQPDIVQDLPPCVFGFLLQFRKPKGPISDPNHIELGKKLHRRLGYGGEKRWPEDVARHTFASNLYPLYAPDQKRVESVMLHSTGAMLKKHYLLKNIPIESAWEYFSHHVPFYSELSHLPSA